jgi:hypothetical protein
VDSQDRDYDELLRRLLHEEADLVEPAEDALDQIRGRLGRPRPPAMAWATVAAPGWFRRARASQWPVRAWLRKVAGGASAGLSAAVSAVRRWRHLAVLTLALAVAVAAGVLALTPLPRQAVAGTAALIRSFEGHGPGGTGGQAVAGSGTKPLPSGRAMPSTQPGSHQHRPTPAAQCGPAASRAACPTPAPTPEPSLCATPAAGPSPDSTPSPSSGPSPTPAGGTGASSCPRPSGSSSPTPTATPTPTQTPTSSPTPTPTPIPTVGPTPVPTGNTTTGPAGNTATAATGNTSTGPAGNTATAATGNTTTAPTGNTATAPTGNTTTAPTTTLASLGWQRDRWYPFANRGGGPEAGWPPLCCMHARSRFR